MGFNKKHQAYVEIDFLSQKTVVMLTWGNVIIQKISNHTLTFRLKFRLVSLHSSNLRNKCELWFRRPWNQAVKTVTPWWSVYWLIDWLIDSLIGLAHWFLARWSEIVRQQERKTNKLHPSDDFFPPPRSQIRLLAKTKSLYCVVCEY